ncbi:MAG: RluA family pseudouridine synthase, partial [Pirellula sp.]
MENIPLDETEILDDADVAAVSSSLSPVAIERRDVEFTVEEEHSGKRVDMFLTFVLDGYSRVFLRKIVADNQVKVNGQVVKPAFKVYTGQKVAINLLPPPPTDGPVAEDIPLDILFEDDCIVIVNKPPGMVVHPAKGHWSGTLTAALAFHFQSLSNAGGPTRPGIVHRLDRDTSGVIAIAKTNEVHFKLCAQFEARDVNKTYLAIVAGNLDRDRDRIVHPIGHHPYQRDKMACRSGHSSSRDAETLFEVIERFRGYSLVNVFPKTGRTHQIRLHLAHIGCPVLCDRLYGGHSQVTRVQLQRRQVRGLRPMPDDAEIVLDRQALHAAKLEFTHPMTGDRMSFEAPLPQDLERTLDVLRHIP